MEEDPRDSLFVLPQAVRQRCAPLLRSEMQLSADFSSDAQTSGRFLKKHKTTRTTNHRYPLAGKPRRGPSADVP
jgi:hypothetical protein